MNKRRRKNSGEGKVELKTRDERKNEGEGNRKEER